MKSCLQYSREGVLVSSPKRVIQGVNLTFPEAAMETAYARLNANRVCSMTQCIGELPGRSQQKSGPLTASPPGLVAHACPGIKADQVETEIPQALALATACIRLWTSSLL